MAITVAGVHHDLAIAATPGFRGGAGAAAGARAWTLAAVCIAAGAGLAGFGSGGESQGVQGPACQQSPLRQWTVGLAEGWRHVFWGYLTQESGLHGMSLRVGKRWHDFIDGLGERSSSAERASGLSAEVGWQTSIQNDRRAIRAECLHATVLLIPGSPVMASTAGTPDVAERKQRSRQVRHLGRSVPGPSLPPGIGVTHPGAGENPYLPDHDGTRDETQFVLEF
jgi:hypothetical protein